MSGYLVVETRPAETRVARLEGGRLAEFAVESGDGDGLTGNIYVGRVENVVKGMQAAFVNIGLDRNAFLFAGDFQFASSDFGADAARVKAHFEGTDIHKLLRPGQEILAQIVKIPGGEKGARISSHVTLPGRLTVLLPTADFVGVSRRIEDEGERERLRKIAMAVKPARMGVILRTASEGAGEAEIAREISALSSEWEDISRRGRSAKAPALIHRDHDVVFRAIRDNLDAEIEKMVFEDEEACARARSAARMISPELEEKIALEKSDIPIFSRYNVNKQLDEALSRRVWLKSGGFLVFDRTEALTVIDVNTGKFVGKTSLSDTVFEINLEAAKEIARQLRLRDIGGIIVIDFIDMDTEERKSALVEALKEALKPDRTYTNVVGLTGLGLVEMTRKKKREPLISRFKTPCPVCGSEGMVMSADAIARDVAYMLQRRSAEGGTLLARASRRVSAALERLDAGVSAYLLADETLNDTEYTISPVLERELPPKARRIGGCHE